MTRLPEDPQAEHERIRTLIAANEERLGVSQRYLIVPQEGVPYAQGTMVPIVGGPSPARSSSSGLRIPGSDPPSHDYMGTYISLDEYVPGAEYLDLQAWADEHRRESLLTALVAVNRVSEDAAQLDALQDIVLQLLPDDASDRLKAALRVPTGGLGRRLVAAHPILMAMRWLIGRAPRTQPVKDATSGIDAVMFSQLIATQLLSREIDVDGDEEVTPDGARRLMLALINLGTYSEQLDVYASIDRTVRLWNKYGHLTIPGLGRDAATLFRDCAGLSVEDLLAVGFGLLADVVAWNPDKPVLLDRAIHADMPPQFRESALAHLMRSLDDCYALGDPVSEYDLLAIETHPVVELPRGLAVLDKRLLWRRCTSGLFWIVHDSLKSQSETDASRFRTAYGDMIEALVEDSLRSMAPTLLADGHPTYFTEDDVEKAYGKATKRRCDAVIDLGSDFLLVEIVSGRLSVPARVDGDLVKLEEDFDRLVLSKCEQLSATADRLLEDEEPLTGVPRDVRFPNLAPALVVGGGIQINPATLGYVRHRLKELDYLQQARVKPICILDLDDVDQLEGLSERGHSVVGLLMEWQESDLCDVPLDNFLFWKGLESDRRPARMESVVDDVYRDVLARVNIKRPPDNDVTGLDPSCADDPSSAAGPEATD